MRGWYLMIKEAGDLKYLCKCGNYKDPIKYKGSGVYWRRYLKKHPDLKIKTEILGFYETPESLREAGLYYSEEFNIIKDKSWANLINEIGDGGSTVKGKIRAYCVDTLEQKFYNNKDELPEGWVQGSPKWSKNKESIEKTRQFHLGRKRSEETRELMRNSTRKKRMTVQCQFCRTELTKQNIKRHENICEER